MVDHSSRSFKPKGIKSHEIAGDKGDEKDQGKVVGAMVPLQPSRGLEKE